MKDIKSILTRIENDIEDHHELDYFWTHSVRYQFILEKILKLNKTGKLLDVGCYPFHLGKVLRELGWNIWGISSPHEPINNDPQIKILNIDKEKFPFNNNEFNIVLFTEVIEHILDPEFSLKEIFRILEKNGTLIITTPNKISPLITIRRIFLSGKSNKEKSSIYHYHNKEFTMEGLKKTVKNIGFKIKTAECFVSYTPFRKQKTPDNLFTKIVKNLNYLLMKTFPCLKDTIYLEAIKI